MKDHWHIGRIAAFLGVGALLYLGLLAGSEWLVRINGARNPFFRITMQEAARLDWIILGASHAMPLDFAGMDSQIEAATGKSILNLAATGAGPFVMRLVADRYFADHSAAGVLIVLDGFGFMGARWNEGRIGDSDFLPRVPFDGATMRTFAAALARLPVASFADYATGFGKINNPDRLSRDVWEAESRFDQTRRPSAAADRARLAYLYPPGAALQARYFDDLSALIALARANGAAVTVVRPPLPDRFRTLLPNEADLAARLAMVTRAQGVAVQDFSALLPDPGHYLDSDHLNRRGVQAWLDGGLRALLQGPVDRNQ